MDKKEEDAVGVDQSLFDFSRMSRRTFMGSTGAASALLGAGASAAEPQTHDVDLLFNMDIGSHVLGLTIVTETGADTKPTWSIDRRVFGPLAKFSLRSRRIYESEATGMVPGQPSYILDVLGFTHASQVPRGLSFWFFQKLTDGFRRWHIRAETDFFSRDGTWNSFQMGAQGRGPNRREANPVPLRSFAEGAALNKGVALKQIISRARINDTMLRIANGMLRGGDDMELSLTKKGVWVLARLGGRPGLVGPGEDMALKNVELRFPEPPQGGEAEGFRGMVISGLYDDKTESRMVLGRADRAGAAALTLRGGELELRCADAAQAAVIGEWTVSHQAGGLTTGGFTCPKARLICTPHVRDGDMEVRFEGDPQHRQPVPWVDTPIGRLRLTGSGIATVPEPSGQVADKFATRRDSAIRAHGVRRPNGSSELVWFEAGLLLSESALALAGRVDYSRLRFANAAITLWHSDRPEAPRGSFVRLGRAPQGSLLARLDLSRAELEAARASDMVSLKFRFAGLALEFLPAVPPELVNALQSCGPVALARPQDAGAPDASAQPLPQTLEDRPTLIVEWPPQHVMEQALFLPNPPPLPDVLLNDSTSLTACNKPNDVAKVVRLVRNDDGWTVAEVPRQQAQDWVDPDLAVAVESLLDRLPSLDERVAARRAIAEAKMAREKCRGGDAYTRFHRAFLDRFGNRGRQHRPPRDQRIYIGDMALDPNSRIRARRLQKQMATNVIRPFVEGMLKNVQAQAVLLWDDPRFVGHDKGDIAAALRLEEQLQSAVPMYQLLRSYYRREMLKALAASGGEATPLQIEYLLAHPDRGRAWPEVEHKLIKDRFIKDGLGGDTPEGVMRARLSAPSRLAFHVDCADTIARARVEVIPPLAPTRASGAGQSPPQSDPDEDAALLSGRNRRAWTFEALTDWSGMEPRVTPRADNVYRSTRGGLLGASSRSMDLSSGARLDQLGFTDGDFVPAGLRMAEVAASLVQPPGPLETEIVIPARLSLSPSREAVFLPTRPAEAAIFHQPDAQGDAAGTCPWPGCGSGRDLAHERDPGFASAFVPLWRVRLDVDAAPPGLRVVHSPDLRPEALLGSLHEPRGPNSKIRFPGGGPPPLGDLAPWLLGREETHAGVPDVSDLVTAMDERQLADPTALTELRDLKDEICTHLERDPRPADRPRLLSYLCKRLGLRKPSEDGSSSDPFFRTSLSANDRHQLVLLSSAWGLPSLGDSSVGSGKEPTRLVPESRHDLADLMPGAMLYNPAALSVQELVLTAMGGCLRHDSAFSPPVSPFHVSGRRLYDALSVERWQHWIQLGRDVRAEVVYKGYLYPIGHRAALVKLTERCFRRDEKSGVIRAYLRQRLFIRVSQPDKPFPAAAQPCNARRFPLRRLSVLTRETPDLADPLLVQPINTDRVQVLPGGRVVLGNRIGLVFWPSLGMAPGSELRFALSCDGAPSRMPLLFVDSTAANDAQVLTQLAAYYNGMDGSAADLRTMPLSGRKLRYAPELRAEQASYDTDAWVLGVEGKSSGLHVISANPAEDGITVETYDFKHSNFNFTPDLQAADQPPFYPVVETARIVLRQNERLTGQSLGAKAASFDGHYVAEGLPQLGDRQARQGGGQKDVAGGEAALEALAKVGGNEMQIVMVLRDQPQQSMKSSGDRSGGIARPAGTIVALSRNKGPVTAESCITIPSLPLSSLPSLALAHTSVPDAAATPASSSDPRRTIAEIRGGLMSGDAKLFGIVKLSDILKAAAGKPGSRAPELVEELFFGVTGGEDQGQEKDNRLVDKTEWLRQTVLRPLRAGVALSVEEWKALELKAAAAQDGRFAKPMTLAELFGPLDQGLNALLAAVDEALAEQDTILLALKLGAVFETGRRLLDAVAELAARPLERVEVAAQERLDDLSRLFADGLLVLSLETWAGLVTGDLKKRLMGALIPDEAALGDLLAFADDAVKLPDGSAQEFLRIVLDDADPAQQRAVLRDWLRERMQKAGDFAALAEDQAVLDALIDRRSAPALNLVDDAEALRQALETQPPDTAKAAMRAAGLLRRFIGGNAELIKTVKDMAQKLDGVAQPGSVQMDAMDLLRQLSPADHSLPEDWAKVSASRIEVFHNTLPKLDIENPQVLSVYLADMALYLRLWQAHVEEVLQIAGAIAAAIETTDDTSPEQAGQAVAVLSGLCDMLSKALTSAVAALSVRWPDRPLPSNRTLDALKTGVGETSKRLLAVKALLDGLPADPSIGMLKDLKYQEQPVLKQFSAEGLLGQFSKDYLDLACLLLDLIAWAQGICPRVPDRLMQALDPVAKAALSAKLGRSGKTLRDLYVELRDSLEKLEQDAGIDARLRQILSQAMNAPPRRVSEAGDTLPDVPKPRTRLEQDIHYLDPERPKPISDNREFFAVFLEEWAAMQSTPFVIARTLEEAFADTIRSEIAQLFDLGALRDRIEDHIQRILPTAVELRYAIDTDLGNFGKEKSAIFIPASDCRLTVTSVARIALGVSGDGISTQFRCDGRIGAFDIKLVGEFEAVALKFHGADFSVDRIGSVNFNPRFDRVEILSQLSFVKFFEFIFKSLQVKIEPRQAGPGLNAVYRQTIPYLELLGISLYNMDLSIGAELPFDGDEALFTLALGARSNPVTIGVAPFYGGSIHVAICANALGIRGFDVAFEWGAARPFEFGPLSGIGRVMIGIYIRQRQVKDNTQTSIYGTFFAGGTGTISCYTVAASLYVRLGAVDGGAMEGEAIFTYSFSLGMFDVSFSVRVHHNQPKPQDQKKDEAKVPPPQKALLRQPYRVAGPATASAAASGAFIETDIRSPQRDWAGFRRYFVNTGSVAEGF